MNNKLITASILAGMTMAGCASSQPSQALLDARAAYAEAEQGPALQYEPEKLDSAKQALDRAEMAYRDDAGSDEEKHLSYLATRRAELAETYGERAAAMGEKKQAREQYVANLEQAHEKVKEKLVEDERQDLVNQQQALMNKNAEMKQKLNMTAEELEQARKAKEQAEKELAKLKEVASVKGDQDETVITIPGAVLFESGKAILMPGAQRKLETVAKVLERKQNSKDLMVVGHTDSQGSAKYNQELSLERAQAVRTFLITHGVKSGNVDAEGMGEAEPVASNDTPEGRANNRRVEIVLTSRDDSTPAPTASRSDEAATAPAKTSRAPDAKSSDGDAG